MGLPSQGGGVGGAHPRASVAGSQLAPQLPPGLRGRRGGWPWEVRRCRAGIHMQTMSASTEKSEKEIDGNSQTGKYMNI